MKRFRLLYIVAVLLGFIPGKTLGQIDTLLASRSHIQAARTALSLADKPVASSAVNALPPAISYSPGYSFGTGRAARFLHPSFVAIDGSDNIFVSDHQNHRIHKITPSGVVSTFVGSSVGGAALPKPLTIMIVPTKLAQL